MTWAEFSMPEPTPAQRYAEAVRSAAQRLGAIPDALIPGLWSLRDHPELTSGQLLDLAGRP